MIKDPLDQIEDLKAVLDEGGLVRGAILSVRASRARALEKSKTDDDLNRGWIAALDWVLGLPVALRDKIVAPHNG